MKERGKFTSVIEVTELGASSSLDVLSLEIHSINSDEGDTFEENTNNAQENNHIQENCSDKYYFSYYLRWRLTLEEIPEEKSREAGAS